jgi:hypothetical protein
MFTFLKQTLSNQDDVNEINLKGAPKTWAQFPIELGNEVGKWGPHNTYMRGCIKRPAILSWEAKISNANKIKEDLNGCGWMWRKHVVANHNVVNWTKANEGLLKRVFHQQVPLTSWMISTSKDNNSSIHIQRTDFWSLKEKQHQTYL